MPERKVQQDLPPKLPSAVPPRRLGGKAKTCPLSSEESDGALSRSEAPHVFLRPASSPARHSFHGLKSVTGLVAQASACVV
jgi:hypothetical protein